MGVPSAGKCCVRTRIAFVLLALGLIPGPSVEARDDLEPHPLRSALERELNSAFVLDGSFVHSVGELQLNMTNWGLIGSRPLQDSTYSAAPSAMWPAGSGNDFLYAAGLWIGAVKLGTPLVSTGQVEAELMPSLDPVDTIYETRRGDRGGNRYPFDEPDDDGDGLEDEEFLDGIDNDRDGLIDEDFAAISNQQFRLHMVDDSPLGQELWPSHDPLEIEIFQESYQWATPKLEDIVCFDVSIVNTGSTFLEQFAVGIYADSDIGPRSDGGSGRDDMVGFVSHSIKASDGLPLSFDIAYMYDCPGGDGDIEGYIGYFFMNSAEPPRGQSARSFHYFARNVPFETGGEPTNDQQRYELLTSGEFQNPPPSCQQANDYRILLSLQPAASSFLPPGGTFRFQMGIAVGATLDELRDNAAEAILALYGDWFDRDMDRSTGVRGRESKVCIDDFGDPRDPENSIFTLPRDCGDPELARCGDQLIRPRLVKATDLDEDGCTWVNLDCPFEFSRGRGLCYCYGPLLDPINPDIQLPCTGRGGREHNVRWLADAPPPAPRMRVWQADNRVHVFWLGEFEDQLDENSGLPVFESYQIWRADGWSRPAGTSIQTGPSSRLWRLLQEYDIVSSYTRIQSVFREHLPLGANTGLDAIRYTPHVLRPTDPEFLEYSALRDLVERIVQENPSLSSADPIRYRGPGGGVTAIGDAYPELGNWECCTDVVDTLTWNAMGLPFYEYIDRGARNGHYYFYAVGSNTIAYREIADEWIASGYGLASNPRTNFAFVNPQSPSQTARQRSDLGQNIYVVPNPATREALAKFSQLEPNEDDPTGVHIEFRNLPRARNTVGIYTLAGDLVTQLRHDGRNGAGSLSWNLVSRNGQEIVSGIYLYSVQSEDDAFDRVVGRFVVVR